MAIAQSFANNFFLKSQNGTQEGRNEYFIFSSHSH